MGYLICKECGGYYKLENGESKEDFVSCECYGSLIYVENIDEYLNGNNESNKDYGSNKDFSENVESELSNVESINEVQLDNFLSDSHSECGLRGELSQKKEISKSLSFSSINGLEEIPSVKNRNYYREIASKEIKPDIKKLKRVKDVDGIIESLNYDDPEVKLDAVQALGAMGDERALKHLNKIKNEERGIIKTYTENAIFHIESKNKGLKSQNRAYYREENYKEITRTASENKDIPTTRSSSRTNNVFKKDVSKTVLHNKSTSKMVPVNQINETEDVDGNGIYFVKFLGIKNTDKPLIRFIFLFVVFLGIGVILTMGYN